MKSLEERIVQTLRTIVAIPSVNPEHAKTDPAVANEARMAAWMHQEFSKLGVEVNLNAFMVYRLFELCSFLTIQTVLAEVEPGRPNVYAIVSSPSPTAKWLGVEIHLDTVSVQGMTPYDPFEGGVDELQRVHGRGTCDTKATLAILVEMIRDLKQDATALPHHVVVAGTISEVLLALGFETSLSFDARKSLLSF